MWEGGVFFVVSRPKRQNRQESILLNNANQILNLEAHAEVSLKSTEATCGHSSMTLKVFLLVIIGVKRHKCLAFVVDELLATKSVKQE